MGTVASKWSRSSLVLTSLCGKHNNSFSRKKKEKEKTCHFCPISQWLLHSLTEGEAHYEDFIKLAKDGEGQREACRAKLAKVNEQSTS